VKAVEEAAQGDEFFIWVVSGVFEIGNGECGFR